MASLKETGEEMANQLEELVGNLRSALTDGDVDFEKLGNIADEISERADGLAEMFGNVNETLMRGIQGGGSSEGSERSGGRKRGGKQSGDNS